MVSVILLSNLSLSLAQSNDLEIRDAKLIPFEDGVKVKVWLNAKAENIKYQIAFDVVSEDNPKYKAYCFDPPKSRENGFDCNWKLRAPVMSTPWSGGMAITSPKIVLEDIPKGFYYISIGLWKPGKVGDADCTDEPNLGTLTEEGCDYDQKELKESVFYLSNGTNLKVGQSVRINDWKTIKLLNVGSLGAVLVDVNGKREIINENKSEIVNGVKIEIIDSFYSESFDKRSANLFIINLEENNKHIVMNVTDIIDIYDKKITLINVAAGENLAIVAVDGEYKTISKGETEIVNNIKIMLEDSKYSENYMERRATLKIVK